MIQSALDKRLQMWEGFCVNHSFAVPQGFVLPKTVGFYVLEFAYFVHQWCFVESYLFINQDESSLYSDQNIQDGSNDLELDAELDSLRNKLNLVR